MQKYQSPFTPKHKKVSKQPLENNGAMRSIIEPDLNHETILCLHICLS